MVSVMSAFLASMSSSLPASWTVVGGGADHVGRQLHGLVLDGVPNRVGSLLITRRQHQFPLRKAHLVRESCSSPDRQPARQEKAAAELQPR